jgi:hypothetical protein
MELFAFFADIKVPVVIAHVITVVFGMGSALLADVLFTFYAKDRLLNPTERKTLELLSTVVWYSLVAIALSGVLLFLSDMPKYLASHKFLAKMTILAVLVLNGYALNSRVWPHLARPGFFTSKRESSVRKLAFMGGAVSVVSWLSVCALGVLDKSPLPYGAIMGIYAGVILGAVSLALLVEDREFEHSPKR